jgi:hypothetical protein
MIRTDMFCSTGLPDVEAEIMEVSVIQSVRMVMPRTYSQALYCILS